jgi:hypothetical protein
MNKKICSTKAILSQIKPEQAFYPKNGSEEQLHAIFSLFHLCLS